MTNSNIIRVSEFEKLYYDNDKPFKKKHWDALCLYQEQQHLAEGKKVEYFKVLNKGIQFLSFVGVIQAGGLTIEILPKTDSISTTAANENYKKTLEFDKKTADLKATWHGVLLDMLKECKLLKINELHNAYLKLRSGSILDIYIELFLLETETLMQQGLIKKYKKESGNKTSLKGQLQFSKQIAYNITHKERFFVTYKQYNQDNILNQILYKTLQLIPKINNNIYWLDIVGRLLLNFPEVSSCHITEEMFERIQYDRKTERYKDAVLFSKILLLNFRPDITGGINNVIAILFDMNKLWEEFIYRRLKKEESIFGIEVLRQQSKNFWLKETGYRSKTIRPDIVLNYTVKKDNSDITKIKTLIVDTKWKNNDVLEPSDEDLKQMFVYNLFWKCNKSILVYPSNNPINVSGNYHSYEIEGQMDKACSILTISILQNTKLDKELGKKLIKAVLDINENNMESDNT